MNTALKILAVLLLFGLVALPFRFYAPAANKTDTAKEIKHVELLSSRGNQFATLTSAEAAKFSLDQILATIRYLFAASAAVLAFVAKMIIEPPAGTAHAKGVNLLLLYASVFWIASMVCGMIAHMFLVEIATTPTFSIYGPIGIQVLFQLIYFALGMLVSLIALIVSI